MITEDYVSFEIAKLLKEKEFDEKVDTFYKTDAEFLKSTLCINYNNPDFELLGMHNIPEKAISAPTLQMAMKWLREEQNLFIEIQCYGCEANKKAHFEYSYVISEFVKIDNKICTVVGLEEKKAKSRFSSYEEACEAAVKYCLENLI